MATVDFRLLSFKIIISFVVSFAHNVTCLSKVFLRSNCVHPLSFYLVWSRHSDVHFAALRTIQKTTTRVQTKELLSFLCFFYVLFSV